MLRHLMTALFAFVLLLPRSASADDTLHRALTRQMETNRQRYGIAGQALLVARDGRVLFRGVDGEADVETHERLTTDHVFAVYSLSKLFVSVLVMQLVEEGSVDLDKPASTYVQGLPASWRAIAVRDFLDHTSGVPEYYATGDDGLPSAGFPRDLETMFASLADTPLQFATGTDTRYTQTNYLVLGALLSAHYGKPYPQVAEERIIRRLGLRRTWLGPGALPGRGVVASYIGKNGRLEKDQTVAWPAYACSHAGLYATLDDLATFLRALTAGDLVGKATLRRLWQPRTLAGGRRGWFAAGWEYGETGAYRYVGHDGGARNRVRIFIKNSPEDFVYTVIYLTNGSARNVWSRTLIDSAMAAAAPERFAAEALSDRLVGYALQTPRRGDANALVRSIRAGAVPAGAALERVVDNTGYVVRENFGVAFALRVFALNTVLFPDSANAWDSLAEAHAANGDQEKAKALYEKARRLAAQRPRTE